MPLTPGMVLGGRYELVRQVAGNDVTEEWAAMDRVLARSVVVEACAAGAPAQPFIAAAAAAARLVHPGIVATYDSGVVTGLPYVVTERPGGATLADVLAHRGPLSAGRVVIVGRQLARALDAAHRMGVVHGGVSAETVTIGEDDRVKLGGFASHGAAGRDRSAAGDVHDLSSTLRAALGGSSGPLTGVLAAAAPGGTITTAPEMAAALDALTIVDDATPPLGTPQTLGGRTSMVAGIVVGLILVAAIGIAGFVLVSGTSGGGSGNTGGSSSGSGRGGDLVALSASSFNPFGDTADKSENQSAAARVLDGGTTTVWSTSEYKTQKFGNLKPGTGIYVLLDARHTLHQLTVTTPATGWVFTVYAADQPATTLAGWGQPIAGPVTVAATVTQVDLKNAPGRAVLVWITDLGPPHAGSAAFPYRVEIAELGVR